MRIFRFAAVLLPAAALFLTLSSRPVAADDVPSVGTVASDFTLSSQEGKTVNLHDFRG
jgi:cytochrome oxidase Cu insertion factor (SCO1/SenC/PrrC family)